LIEFLSTWPVLYNDQVNTLLRDGGKMKLTTFITGVFLACTALAQYNVTSKPFHLRTLSHDEKYNGTYLYACHEGAAIEGLCIGDKNASAAYTYHLVSPLKPTRTVTRLKSLAHD
jgi:hypothetical protein